MNEAEWAETKRKWASMPERCDALEKILRELMAHECATAGDALFCWSGLLLVRFIRWVHPACMRFTRWIDYVEFRASGTRR
jgi:hypothetical protein